MRTVTIQGHTAAEIGRYRALKLLLGIAMIPLAYHGFAQSASRRVPAMVPLPSQPLITHDEAMRSDFPIRWSRKSRGTLRPLGANTILGTGPANTDTFLYDGDRAIGTGRTGADGRWRLALQIAQPGLHSYHIEFRRNGIGMGQTRSLSAMVLDRKSTKGSDVSITNFRPLDVATASRFTLRGSAPPGDFVQIYVDATLLGRAEVDLAGRWSFRPKIQGGGRRTFTIVDEITSRQFGPFPLRILPRPQTKPVPKAKPVAKSNSAPAIPGAKPTSAGSVRPRPATPRPMRPRPISPIARKAVRNPVKAVSGRVSGTTTPKTARFELKSKSTPKSSPKVKKAKGPVIAKTAAPAARPKAKPRRTTALGVYAPLN